MIQCRLIIVLFFILNCSMGVAQNEIKAPTPPSNLHTFCNPLDLSYRFRPEKPSRREAADPTIIPYKDGYLMFASKSGGYWFSKALKNWRFVASTEFPTEEYAPTAITLKDTVYFLASSREKSTLYKSADPLSGKWQIAVEALDEPVWDPAFFVDDDERLYLYWGCSNETPIYGVELDYKHGFGFKSNPKTLIYAKPSSYGWEVPGDYNNFKNRAPWIEGAWMNKHQGNYYLQYSGPGTEYKSYADAVYISEYPLGPYRVAEHNPFAYKPEGFASGAGHGSTFEDRWGNFWHVGTVTISQKHIFERRLALYPTFFDADGTLHTITKYGDYPMIIPDKKITDVKEIFPDWMLLSYKKPVQTSSAIDSLPAINMVDENIRTYWAAKTGNAKEWASIDLEDYYDVYALQLNFAEHGTEKYSRNDSMCHRYTVQYSQNGIDWIELANRSKAANDNSHQYLQLPKSINCRYLRIRNLEVPDGNFALSGFRVFGKGSGYAPSTPNFMYIRRNEDDKRTVNLRWKKVENAIGYVINYGTNVDKLYHSYMVYEKTALTINSLNAEQPYHFTIEAFNENGITINNTIKTAN